MKNGLYIENDGTKAWYLNGKRHREDGPAIEWSDGRKWWITNGLFHREDGPAIERFAGTKVWYLNGKVHRADGPAIVGRELCEWWIDGEEFHESGDRFLPQNVLINYMKANNYTLAHLLTDPDPLVRKSATKYEWKEVI
jgi:hypothetical protein